MWKASTLFKANFTVVSPGALQSQTVSGSVVFAENCYGAQIVGRTSADSCALALVRQGAASSERPVYLSVRTWHHECFFRTLMR